jgi:tetratricopeptide (TPR) repeat protein
MRTLIGLMAVLLLAAGAHAGEEDDLASARTHYRRGMKAYDLGRYLDAAHEYEQAYDAKEDPALLFNIAQAYRLGGDNASAVRAYRSFLRRVPRAPNRAEVEARIDELQKILDQQVRAKEGPPDGTLSPGKEPRGETTPSVEAKPAVAPPPAAAPSPPERTPIYKRWWLWAAVGGAVAVVAIGVGLGVGLSQNGFGKTLPDVGPGTTGALTVRW